MQTTAPSFTATEWAQWLAEAERNLREVYRLSPQRLIAEYRREREVTRGYHGREILELLQNAGDAAQLAGVPGRVRIVVNTHGVAIGNTGQPFDLGGVLSLQTANLSPKRQRESAVIGDKGLGFRSILNWTQCPLVSSGQLGLAFLPGYAGAVVAEMESECAPLAEWVRKERAHAADLIAPRLAFPKWIADWTNETWEGTEGLQAIAEVCERMRVEGFDTAVGLPFTYSHSHEEALRQVAELRAEILLVVESIDRLEIEIDDGGYRVWRREQTGNIWTVIENDRTLGTWTVSSSSGEVPEDLLDPAESSQKAFRLTIAVPERPEPTAGRLFCYFPTEVELPLPLLCHATVQLDETRKHLNDTRANRHILRQLAEKIAAIAEQRSALPESGGWSGCLLLVPQSAWGGDLQRLGFRDHLKQTAKAKRLIPALAGGHLCAREAKLPPGADSRWLPARHFPEVAAVWQKEEWALAQHLEVAQLAPGEIAERLVAAGDLSVAERAHAVAGLLRLPVSAQEGFSSRLLCDEADKPIPDGTSAILQPAGAIPRLPHWATIRFLHPELRIRLGELLGTTDSRELQQKLRPFGVMEYSMAALIGPVLAEANRQVREAPETERQVRSEALGFLWQVYKGSGGAQQTATFPAGVTLKLPTQSGGFASPGELYLGEGYGSDGNITQDLFSGWGEENLVARPEALGTPAGAEELAGFLIWLGIARWPREVKVERIETGFTSEVVNGLRYPAQFGDYDFQGASEVPEPQFAEAKSVHGLGRILESAPPEAVLAWLARDARAAEWAMASPQHGKLTVRRNYAQNRRAYAGPLPSYVHWEISRTQWLPISAGQKAAPRHCLLGERLIENLFPRPTEPREDLLERYGTSPEVIRHGFFRSGVIPGLGQLGRDDFYRLLLEVPSHSPDGKASKALCRSLLQLESNLFGAAGEYQKQFFRDGRMWGTKGKTTGYFRLSELRHVDTDGFPVELLREVAVVDLPKRVGSDKVERLFSIKALDRLKIQKELLAHRKSAGHELREDWFEQAKPYLKRLRDSQTTQTQNLGTLERLKLIVCDEVRVRLTYEGATHDHEAAEGEWFIFDDTLHVRSDLADSLDLLADAVGTAIASVFRLADGDSFSKILRCEPANRTKLLRRMCGDDFQDEIERTKVSDAPGSPYSGPIIPPSEPDPEGVAGKLTTAPVVPSDSDDQRHIKESPGESEPGIRKLERTSQPPHIRRRLTVRRVERTPGRVSGARQVVDGDLCERKAMEFEEFDEPPRFPLQVGNITGVDAPGCDVLSFASEEDRKAFITPETRDWTTVQRFVEVKGRSSATAKIELRDNELKAARTYRDRYFLYRFYEQSPGEYLVSVLRDPLGAEEAKSLTVHIDLERANGTERYQFVSGTAKERVEA